MQCNLGNTLVTAIEAMKSQIRSLRLCFGGPLTPQSTVRSSTRSTITEVSCKLCSRLIMQVMQTQHCFVCLAGGEDSGSLWALLQPPRGGPKHFRHSQNGWENKCMALIMPHALHYCLPLLGCWPYWQSADRGGQVAPLAVHY